MAGNQNKLRGETLEAKAEEEKGGMWDEQQATEGAKDSPKLCDASEQPPRRRGLALQYCHTKYTKKIRAQLSPLRFS